MFLYLQWFVDNEAQSPGDLVLFRTVTQDAVNSIDDGAALAVLQEQDTVGENLRPMDKSKRKS